MGFPSLESFIHLFLYPRQVERSVPESSGCRTLDPRGYWVLAFCFFCPSTSLPLLQSLPSFVTVWLPCHSFGLTSRIKANVWLCEPHSPGNLAHRLALSPPSAPPVSMLSVQAGPTALPGELPAAFHCRRRVSPSSYCVCEVHGTFIWALF